MNCFAALRIACCPAIKQSLIAAWRYLLSKGDLLDTMIRDDLLQREWHTISNLGLSLTSMRLLDCDMGPR